MGDRHYWDITDMEEQRRLLDSPMTGIEIKKLDDERKQYLESMCDYLAEKIRKDFEEVIERWIREDSQRDNDD